MKAFLGLALLACSAIGFVHLWPHFRPMSDFDRERAEVQWSLAVIEWERHGGRRPEHPIPGPMDSSDVLVLIVSAGLALGGIGLLVAALNAKPPTAESPGSRA